MRRFYSGTTVSQILPQIVLATAVATLVYYWHLNGYFDLQISIVSNGHTVLGKLVVQVCVAS